MGKIGSTIGRYEVTEDLRRGPDGSVHRARDTELDREVAVKTIELPEQIEAREREAQAEARATAMVSKAIQAGNPQAINYFVAQKYVDALGRLAAADNNKVILMPLEAADVIGSLGGVAEIVKTSFGPGRA